MQEPILKEVEKAMNNGGYVSAIYVGARPFIPVNKNGILNKPLYKTITYVISEESKKPGKPIPYIFQVAEMDFSDSSKLDEILQKADKPVHEEPMPGVAMFKKRFDVAAVASQ